MFAIDFQFVLRTLEILGRFIYPRLKLYAYLIIASSDAILTSNEINR